MEETQTYVENGDQASDSDPEETEYANSNDHAGSSNTGRETMLEDKLKQVMSENRSLRDQNGRLENTISKANTDQTAVVCQKMSSQIDTSSKTACSTLEHTIRREVKTAFNSLNLAGNLQQMAAKTTSLQATVEALQETVGNLVPVIDDIDTGVRGLVSDRPIEPLSADQAELLVRNSKFIRAHLVDSSTGTPTRNERRSSIFNDSGRSSNLNESGSASNFNESGRASLNGSRFEDNSVNYEMDPRLKSRAKPAGKNEHNVPTGWKSNPSTPATTKNCGYCGRNNHFWSTCRERPDDYHCFRCLSTQHLDSNCPFLKVVCSQCRKTGHHQKLHLELDPRKQLEIYAKFGLPGFDHFLPGSGNNTNSASHKNKRAKYN